LKLLFVVTEDWYFVSHRLGLARAARDAGYDVTVATRPGSDRATIEAAGIRFVPFALARRSGNPVAELLRLRALYRHERPDLVHHVAMKPVIFGSAAAWLAGVPAVVNAVAGLGWMFTSDRAASRLLRPAVRAALGLLLRPGRGRVIVQNPDDADALRGCGVPRERIRLIPGAGVDPDVFVATPEPDGPLTVVMASRMLRDKGVMEFTAAARALHRMVTRDGCEVRFVLAGAVDPGNPATLEPAQLRAWEAEGILRWDGLRTDMPAVLAAAHVVCLPSYREGLPKVLLEAASCGRPIVTTDTPGCRDVVEHGRNGLLVPPRDSAALTAAIRRLLDDHALRASLGAAGRATVLERYTGDRVNDATLAVYRELGAAPFSR
jgi:glycosyltransferase involved in cell wall biosynthesis